MLIFLLTSNHNFSSQNPYLMLYNITKVDKVRIMNYTLWAALQTYFYSGHISSPECRQTKLDTPPSMKQCNFYTGQNSGSQFLSSSDYSKYCNIRNKKYVSTN